MISGATSCYPSNNLPQGSQMYAFSEDINSSSLPPSSSWESHSNSLIYSLSLLKEKVHQVESLVTLVISPDQAQPAKSTAISVAGMGTLVQEIMVTSSSMMFTCQQMALFATPPPNTATNPPQNHRPKAGGTSTGTGTNARIIHASEEREQGFYSSDTLDWYSCDNHQSTNMRDLLQGGDERKNERSSPKNYDIIELDAADLLAKYTHYCQVCGKGFKRDANLRMHMRAHGDEYKSSAALTNPAKRNKGSDCLEATINPPRKYSCPQEGCRWNRKHAKFQPLKSMICVKNHYKRSHCPKMYVCKRCNRKQFSVLSDLRTHEKHCGDLKWQCSCGTTFSRKDKLMGHVALFVGHAPAINGSPVKVVGNVEERTGCR